MKPLLLLLALLCETVHAEVGWKSRQLDPAFYTEGGAIADINKDGKQDVIAGPYWDAGPDFKTRHEIFAPKS